MINVMCLNHPETTPPLPQPGSMEKLSSKIVFLAPAAKKVGDCALEDEWNGRQSHSTATQRRARRIPVPLE